MPLNEIKILKMEDLSGERSHLNFSIFYFPFSSGQATKNISKMKFVIALAAVSLGFVSSRPVSIGPRPYWLVDQMREGALKSELGKTLSLQKSREILTF